MNTHERRVRLGTWDGFVRAARVRHCAAPSLVRGFTNPCTSGRILLDAAQRCNQRNTLAHRFVASAHP